MGYYYYITSRILKKALLKQDSVSSGVSQEVLLYVVNGFVQLPIRLCIINCTVRILLFDKKDDLTSTMYAKNIFSIIFTIKYNI